MTIKRGARRSAAAGRGQALTQARRRTAGPSRRARAVARPGRAGGRPDRAVWRGLSPYGSPRMADRAGRRWERPRAVASVQAAAGWQRVRQDRTVAGPCSFGAAISGVVTDLAV